MDKERKEIEQDKKWIVKKGKEKNRVSILLVLKSFLLSMVLKYLIRIIWNIYGFDKVSDNLPFFSSKHLERNYQKSFW